MSETNKTIILENLEAFLADIEHGPEEALSKLSDNRGDADSIRSRLVILLENNKFTEASDLISDMSIEEEWCEYAPATLLFAGKENDAQNMYDEIRSSFGPDKEPLRLRTTLRYAQSRMGFTFKARTDPDITIGSLSDEEKAGLRKCLEILNDAITTITRNATVQSMLEANLVRTAKDAAMLLEDMGKAREMANLLATHKPILLQVARDVHSTLIDPPAGICERLRADHPDNFEALSLAVHIQGLLLGECTPAIRAAVNLKSRATTREEKKYLAELLTRIPAPSDMQDEVLETARKLLEDDSQTLAIMEAEQLLREKKPGKAEEILDSVRDEDSAEWLQVYAHALKDQGKKEQAAKWFLAASEKVQHPDLFRKTAEATYNVKRFDDTIKALENALRLDPDDTNSLHNLAALYAQQKEYGKAVEHLQRLRENNPEDENNLLNLAFSLRETGKTDESLEIYNELLTAHDSTLHAVVGRVQLLEGMGKPVKAFDSLQEHKDRFWEDVNFVMVYWKLASSADHDDLAHEAFLQMNALKEKGDASDDLFRMVNLDEIKTMMKENAEQTRKRTKTVHTEMLKGRMPWLWAEEMANNTSYWGWRVRTQEFDWIFDDSINRANYCIYATNSFHAGISKRDTRELLPIECPPKNTKIVADLSVLITLHRLGLLNEALDYFGEVIIPAVYLSKALEETSRLTPHQLSRKSLAEAIEEKIRTTGITLAETLGRAKADGMIHVHEHYIDEQPGQYYHLKDVLRPLHDAGKISQQEFERADRVAQKPSVVDDDHPTIKLGQSLLFDLSALETLTGCDLLDITLDCFSVAILKEAEEEIVARLASFGTQEKVQKWHLDLWDNLRNDSRVSFVPHKLPKELEKEGKDIWDEIGFSATFLAQSEKLPLMTDDRVSQAFNLSENSDISYAAFGADTIINALANDSIINSAKHAECYVQLMAWRYRFLITPADVLVVLAKQYEEHPPGQPLRDIARYIHDCMRDPGLFGGVEATDQPASIAMRLFMSWISTIAEFLMDVWCDTDIDEKALKDLTQWAITEFLPSPPRVVAGLQKVRISDMTVYYVISQAMICSIQKENIGRAGDCLESIRVAFGIDEKEYLKIVTGVLDAI